MKTFKDWCKYQGYESYGDPRIEGYLNYALREIRQPVNHYSYEQGKEDGYNRGRDDAIRSVSPPIYAMREFNLPPSPTLTYAVDLAAEYASGYKAGKASGKIVGFQDGKEAGIKIRSGYGSLKLGERAISTREFDRLVRRDEEAKCAFDRGYVEANRQYRSARTTPKIKKAARECAMTYCIGDSNETYKAVCKLRQALGIDSTEVIYEHYNKNQLIQRK